MQDFDPCGELGSFLIELVGASDLPSQPPVIKVANVALEVHEVTAWPNEEGVEPGRERFDGVFFAVPNCVSLRIQVNNVRGLIWALLFVEPSNSTVFLIHFADLKTLSPRGMKKWGTRPSFSMYPSGAHLNMFS